MGFSAAVAASFNKWLGYRPKAETQTLKLTTDEQQWLTNNQVVNFTGDPNWLPYEAFDEQGNYIVSGG